MNERDYERMQENEDVGRKVRENLDQILRYEGVKTLRELQYFLYKQTVAGVSVSFELHDGSFLYPGDARAPLPEMLDHVRKVGVACIVEGSDAEVPGQWLDLLGYDAELPTLLLDAWDALVERVDKQACEWAKAL